MPTSDTSPMSTPVQRIHSDGIRTLATSIVSPIQPFQNLGIHPHQPEPYSLPSETEPKQRVEGSEETLLKQAVVSEEPKITQAQSLPYTPIPHHDVKTNPKLPVARVQTNGTNPRLVQACDTDPSPSEDQNVGIYDGVERSVRDTVPESLPQETGLKPIEIGSSVPFHSLPPGELPTSADSSDQDPNNTVLKRLASMPAVSCSVSNPESTAKGTDGNDTMSSLEMDAGPSSVGSYQRSASHQQPPDSQGAVHITSTPASGGININMPAGESGFPFCKNINSYSASHDN